MRSADVDWGLRMTPVVRVVAVVVALLVALAVIPVVASAESMCTDDWSGSSEGEWSTPANWSAGHVPGSSDVACIGSGNTVKVTSGGDLAGVVQGEGGVTISGGALEVTNALETSTIRTLTITGGGTLTGAATVRVSASFTSESAKMKGAGSTIILSSASGTVGKGESYIEMSEEHSFVNEGTITSKEGAILLYETAQVKNTGTFKANAQNSFYAQFSHRSGSASVVNNGTIEKTEGTGETRIEGAFENVGTLNGASGTIGLTGASAMLSSGSTLEGTIVLEASAMTAGSFKASSATVTLASGTLSVNSASTATIGTLSLVRGGTVAGAGTLDVSGSFTSEAGKMKGTGSTVILSSASGLVGKGESYLELTEGRSFVNEGTITSNEGAVFVEEGAQLKNSGTFKANSQNTHFAQFAYTSLLGSGTVINTGLIEKTEGTEETRIEANFENDGTLNGASGTIDLNGISKALSSGSTLEGTIVLEASAMTAGSFKASSATVTLASGTLSVNSASTATIGTLTLARYGTVAGAGTLDVSGSFISEGGTMKGAGSTVILSSASGTVGKGESYLELHEDRSFVNEGTITSNEGAIFLGENTQFENIGTFKANAEAHYAHLSRFRGTADRQLRRI